MTDPQQLILSTLSMLLARREEAAPEVRPDSRLFEDLDLDSLEAAELSTILEDELGRDPYSEGLVPETVDDIVAYYAA